VECPRREEDSPNSMNFIDTIFSFQDENEDDEYVDITQKQLDEIRKRGGQRERNQSSQLVDRGSKDRIEEEVSLDLH